MAVNSDPDLARNRMPKNLPLVRRLLAQTFMYVPLAFGVMSSRLVAGLSNDKSVIYPTPSYGALKSIPVPLKPGPHLLLDEFLIKSSSNLTRRVNVPVRDTANPNPIVTGKEDGCFQPYFSVVNDAESGHFRIWYGIHTDDFDPARSHIGYMESRDGVQWIRPHRALVDPSPIQFGVSVLDEGPAFPDPSERFKYAWWFGGGLRIATSPDGLKWTPVSPDVLIPHNHDITGLHWDPLRSRFVATVSFYITGPAWSGKRRVTKHSVSTDLLKWSAPWIVLAPDDRLDEGETQFYAMDGYLARGDLIIGMAKVLRDDLKADQPPDPPNAYGIGYTALAWTHDGEHWIRDRERFFDRHPQKGEWDHAHAWIDEQVLVGDEVYLYYGGYRRGHKVNRFEERQIGLVKMKRDRYVAREAGAQGGSFKTPLIVLNAAALTLNVEAPAGEVTVQITDAKGKPLHGFTRKDCLPVSGDTLSAPVRWRNKSLSAVKGKPVHMVFFLENARLFSFDLSSGMANQ